MNRQLHIEDGVNSHVWERLPQERGSVREQVVDTLWKKTLDLARPKESVADYVENELAWDLDMQKLLRVPRRFKDLTEVLATPVENVPMFYIRSEDNQAFAGMSGVFPTWIVYRDKPEAWKLFVYTGGWSSLTFNSDSSEKILDYYNEEVHRIKQEFGLQSIKTGFSIWEWIKGNNYCLVADTWSQNAFYVYDLNWFWDPTTHISWEDWDNEEIRIYNWIRSRNLFPAWNCPIIELAEKDGVWYFLQYLKTQNTQYADFNINEIPKDYIEADFIRGITPSWGIELTIYNAHHYHEESRPSPTWFYVTNGTNKHPQFRFDIERMTSEVDVVLLWATDEWIDNYGGILNVALYHYGRSMIHKPKLFLILWKSGWYSRDGKFDQVTPRNTEEWISIVVHIISDGKRAIIKRVK